MDQDYYLLQALELAEADYELYQLRRTNARLKLHNERLLKHIQRLENLLEQSIQQTNECIEQIKSMQR